MFLKEHLDQEQFLSLSSNELQYTHCSSQSNTNGTDSFDACLDDRSMYEERFSGY